MQPEQTSLQTRQREEPGFGLTMNWNCPGHLFAVNINIQGKAFFF